MDPTKRSLSETESASSMLRAALKRYWSWLLKQYWWFVPFAALFVVVAILMSGQDPGHKPLQLVGNAESAADFFAQYTTDAALETAVDNIETNIRLDIFLFVPAYVLMGIGLVRLVRDKWYIVPGLKHIGDRLISLIVFAGIFDIVETALIWSYLPQNGPADIAVIGSWKPVVATALAMGKYVALAGAIGYVGPALLGFLWRETLGRLFGMWKGSYALAIQRLTAPKRVTAAIVPDERPTTEGGRPDAEGVGFCFSGGGIRAGSFAIGGLQALQHKHKLSSANTPRLEAPKVISAVSGGGYTTGAYEMTRARGDFEKLDDPENPGEDPGNPGHDQARPYELGSPEAKFMRNHSSFLTTEPGQKFELLAQLLRGIAMNAAVIFLLLYVALRPIGWLLWSVNDALVATVTTDAGVSSKAVQWVIPAAHWSAFALTLIPALIGFLLTLAPVITRGRVGHDRVNEIRNASLWWAGLTVFVLIGIPGAFWLVFTGAASFFRWLPTDLANEQGLIATVAGTAALMSILGAAWGLLKKASTSIWAILAGTIVLPLLLAYVVSAVTFGGYSGGISDHAEPFGFEVAEFTWWLIVGGALALWWVVSDQRAWSMHRFYKRRLEDAFSVQREGNSVRRIREAKDYDGYTDFRDPKKGPMFVSVCVANLNQYGIVAPGLRAVPFTFDYQQVGSPDLGYIERKVLEKRLAGMRRHDMTVPAAIAISGAAASPAMGKGTLPWLRFLLAFANVRLGVWFPNPLWLKENNLDTMPSEDDDAVWFERPRLSYLLKEMFGIHSPDDRFLYLTDGGHIDNLGLVEALRRRCKYVYAFDASGGKPGTFPTIGEAVALAAHQLGVEVSLEGITEVMRGDGCPPPGTTESSDWSSAPAGTGWPWTRPSDAVGGVFIKQPYAVGTIKYPGDVNPSGKLIYIQAAVTKTTPLAVRWHWEQFPDFPNNSTIDQNFDFREFEAYRALGYWATNQALTEGLT